MTESWIIALISAGSALSGVLISAGIALLISYLDKTHAKETLLCKKYEEMMFEFHNSLSYFQDVQNAHTHEQMLQMIQSPHASKAVCYAQIYFPEVVDSLHDHLVAQNTFFRILLDNFKETSPITAGEQFTQTEDYLQIIKKVNHFKEAAIETLATYTPKYTGV